MITDNKPIILYPREYNLRGGDARSSVKGITHDGELVTIKLRVDGAIHTVEAIPSISSFAKTSTIESRQSCLASLDNGPQKPMGILIFIRCDLEENPRDPDKNYPVYYTSRWAYVLRTGHQPLTADFRGDLPFIGTGRVVIDKRNRQILTAKENMARLEKNQPEGWREAFARNEAILKDYRSYDYHLYGYLTEQESIFADEDESALVAWMDKVMGPPEENAHNGIFFRIEIDDGVVIKELVREVFPIYDTVFRRHQNGAELLSYFKSSNPDLNGIERFNYRVMPLIRFAGKKIFKDSLRSQSDFDELEQTYYLRDEPLVMPLAVRIDRLDNKDLLINKIHKTGPSLGLPALLDISGKRGLRFEGESLDAPLVFENRDSLNLMSSGLAGGGSLSMASWYSPVPIDPASVMTSHHTAEGEVHLFTPTVADDTPSCDDVNAFTIDPPPSSTIVPDDKPTAVNDTVEPEIAAMPECDEDEAHSVEPAMAESLLDTEDLRAEAMADADAEAQDIHSGSILDMAESLSDDLGGSGEETGDDSSLFGSTPISFEHFSQEDESAEQPACELSDDQLTQIPETTVIEVKADGKASVQEPETVIDPPSSNNGEEQYLTSLDDILKASDQEGPVSPENPLADNELEAILPAWDAVEDALAAEQEPVDDSDAWMDDDELVEVLSESPDAYSDETEADSPTVIDTPSSEPKIPTPATPSIAVASTVSTVADESPQAKPKKGGLASFVRARQQK